MDQAPIRGIKQKIPVEQKSAKESRNIMLKARPTPISYPKIKVPGRATMTRMLDELDAIADE